MNFEEFKNTIKSKIGTYLSEEYENATYSITRATPSGKASYDALVIRRNGERCVPVLNLDIAYNNYQHGKSLEQICKELADVRMNAPFPEMLAQDALLDFSKAKDKIFPRLVNTEANKAFVGTIPHTSVEDLSVIYAIRVDEDAHNFEETCIDAILLKIWGVDTEEIHKVAMRNLEAQTPIFMNLEDAMFNRYPVEFDLDSMDTGTMPIYLLTNRYGVRGAAMALCGKVMDAITAKFGNVYVLPSSVDEVMIVPKAVVENHEMEFDDIENMVQIVNMEAVRPELRLSDHIYEYDSETQSLKLAVVPEGAGIGLQV